MNWISGRAGFGAAALGAPRIWTYTYNINGQVLTENGLHTALTEISQSVYDAAGNLKQFSNAQGHQVQVAAQNAHGQPPTFVDPNGLQTMLAYDFRQRLSSRTVGGSEATTFNFELAEQLLRVARPNGSFTQYGYDAAGRIVGVEDNPGNRIADTLDGIGNRIKEDIYAAGGMHTQTRRCVFDCLSRLAQDIGAVNQTTAYGYAPQGNVTSITDALGRVTTRSFDAINRLIAAQDPAGDLGPDPGATVNLFDAAGNVVDSTNAKGEVLTQTYDALNRVTQTLFFDGLRHTYV